MRSHRFRAFLAVGIAVLACADAARSVQIHRVVALPGHVPAAALADATDLGLVPSGEILSLALVLPLRNSDALDDLLRRLYDPADPLHGRFLSADEFVSRFGPTQESYDAVIAFAPSHGLTISGTHPNRLLLDVSGPAASVESAFGVELREYRAADGRTFRAPVADPVVPAALASDIRAVVGLETSEVFRSHLQARSLETESRMGIGSGPGSMLSPSDIRKAYGLSGVTADGTGQTLALFELDGYRAEDIAAYEKFYGLPAVALENVLLDHFSGAAGDESAEATMDIELQIALAPGVREILVYEAPNCATGTLDAYNRIATDDAASSISASWGMSEDRIVSSLRDSEYSIFRQMAAQGQTLFAAAGDYGAYDDLFALSVDDPASQPYVCGVGGTSLAVNADGSYRSESAWNDGTINAGAGGGGFSGVWTIPEWQKSAATASSGASTACRNVPDVSLHADPNAGYSIYFDGAWRGGGGTSAAAPLWSAFAALVNQRRTVNGASAIGFFNPTLYRIAGASSGAVGFHDIDDGTTNLHYQATEGYDNATGLGSLDGAALFAELTDTKSPSTPTNLTATAGSARVQLAWNASTEAENYNVKRSASSGGPYATIASVSRSSYADSGLTNGATYYYVVSATNAAGESADSEEVSATPQLTIPAPPTNFTAFQANGLILLSWKPSALAKRYKIKRSSSKTGTYSTLATVTNSNYADASLAPGKTYFYTVAASNAAGESPDSSRISVTLPSIPPPSVPANLKATAGNALVKLSWSASFGATRYKVKRSTSETGAFATVATPATPYYADAGVKNGTTYFYVVSAASADGESSDSAKVSATPTAP